MQLSHAYKKPDAVQRIFLKIAVKICYNDLAQSVFDRRTVLRKIARCS